LKGKPLPVAFVKAQRKEFKFENFCLKGNFWVIWLIKRVNPKGQNLKGPPLVNWVKTKGNW